MAVAHDVRLRKNFAIRLQAERSFFLRPQLKWSNGEPLTARDFVYAWRRLLSPEQASPSAGLLLATGINNAQSIYAGALDLDALGV